MRPLHRTLLGAALLVGGSLLALLYVGVYFIADCSQQCEARGERLVVLALIALGVVLMGLGGWMVRRGLKRR